MDYSSVCTILELAKIAIRAAEKLASGGCYLRAFAGIPVMVTFVVHKALFLRKKDTCIDSSMAQSTHLHLQYLDTLSEVLGDKHPSQAARLGYIAKQVCEKHVVHIRGVDAPKLLRCKACRAFINIDSIKSTKSKTIEVRCNLCNQSRFYGLTKKKTKNSESLNTDESGGAREQN